MNTKLSSPRHQSSRRSLQLTRRGGPLSCAALRPRRGHMGRRGPISGPAAESRCRQLGGRINLFAALPLTADTARAASTDGRRTARISVSRHRRHPAAGRGPSPADAPPGPATSLRPDLSAPRRVRSARRCLSADRRPTHRPSAWAAAHVARAADLAHTWPARRTRRRRGASFLRRG